MVIGGGCTDEPVLLVNKLRNYRRCGLIPPLTSISWNIREKNIYIYTDEGTCITSCLLFR